MAPFYTRTTLFLPLGVHRKTLMSVNYWGIFHMAT